MATDWKKILQAGALATDALSRGSAGGLGKALVESKIDLSGKPKTNRITGEKHENNRPNPHNQDVNQTGGQGNKQRNMSYKEIE
tara:strand:+ start:882 stop:1133 length:252 start_codon:yes stop_codon:yes gene_type:complete